MSGCRFDVVSNLFNLRFRNLGYIIGFSAILLIFTSNLMINHQNFSTAYPIVNKVSFNYLGKLSIVPIKDNPRGFGPSFITTNPNNEEWKNRLCENTNQAGINIGIPFICDPADNIGQNGNTDQQNGNTDQQNGNTDQQNGNTDQQNGNTDQQNGNTDQQNGNTDQQGQGISDKLHEKIGNLKEKIGDSIFGNNESDNSQSNNVQSDSENEDRNGKDSNNNKNDDDGNNEKNSEQHQSDEQGAGNTSNEFNDDNANGNGNQRNTNDGNNANNGNNQANNGNNQANNGNYQANNGNNQANNGNYQANNGNNQANNGNYQANNGNNQANNGNYQANNGNNQANNGNYQANNGNNQANNGNNQGNNNDDDGLGIAGLDLGLNIDKKLGKVDEKINNLKDNLGLGQQENKFKQKNNNDQGNNDDTLRITGLTPNVQNIQANLEKQIEKLKDKFENEQDNQRLIDQRNEFDDDDDDTKDNEDDGDDGNGKDYDGYGFKGDDDNGNGNGNGHEDGEENFNFAAAGDFGCSTNTQNTIENMQSKDPEIVLTLGDLSYHSTADCWFDMMSPVKDKLMLTLGYHDVEDGQAKMNQYMNSFALEKPFYSYDYNNVHFLVMSAKSVYYKGSEQYNFVVDDLKKASENENVNWIVVSSYGPPYTSPSEHTAFKELREVYHPIFEKYGVDLVLGGHNHNYQRTYPLTYNPNDSGEPKITNTATGEYKGQKDGIVFAIVGTGGVNLYPFTGQAPFVEKQFANKFGYLNIDISNGNPHSKLTGTFYDNKGGQILDQFTIDKDLNSKNSELVSG